MSESTSICTEFIDANTQTRRLILKTGGVLLLSLLTASPRWACASTPQVVAIRVWPANDYTRVTLENSVYLNTKTFTMRNPERFIVDLEGVQLNEVLKDIVAKIQPDDPYIKQVRVAQNRPDIVRLVFDLKASVDPQIFTLKPTGNYQYRLVLDFYPKHVQDPLAIWINQQTWSASANKTIEKNTSPHSRLPKVSGLITIVLDPGHGGEDPGAIGLRGHREKDVVLEIAKRIKKKLERVPHMRVMMTRDADFFVPLGVRVQKARQVKADLFVSIHADAFITPIAQGSSVFALSEKGASSTAARWLAHHENVSDLIGGVNIKAHDKQLARVLLDLSTTAQIRDSLTCGKIILEEIEKINTLHKPAVEQAGFAVLKAPDIPSILIETAFISHPEEELKLTSAVHQDKLAQAVVVGIQKYFAKNPAMARKG